MDWVIDPAINPHSTYLYPMYLPPPLLASLQGVTGFNRAAFEAIHDSGEQVTSIRLNPFKSFAGHANWVTTPVPWCPAGRYLATRPSFTLDPVFHAGAYYVQEASSMFLWHALQQTVGNCGSSKVLDLCAAPGGKSSLLASYFSNGLVVANEVIKSRATVLVENMCKWGADQVIVTNNDPAHFKSVPGFFDVMVVDAPCSGSGLFRKDPAAVAEWSADNVQLCSQRQQRILADVLPALKQDGILVYATCSYSPAEDENIADWLLGEMDMDSLPVSIPAQWGIVETQSPVNKAYGYRFYPDKVKGEGFFIAVFKKKAATENIRIKEQAIMPASRSETKQVHDFIRLPDTYTLFKQAESIRALKKEWFVPLQQLAKHLYIKKAGVEIGSIKGKDIIPSHELAMSLLPLNGFAAVELTETQALQYLRRKEIMLETAPGWCLVQYATLPLGWVKVLPNRVNNYYPSEWRILKE